ncbi:MAG: YbhB/YbcL family Raf kinase inhibitor-like protein [Kofleriaceae bacterium]
MRTIIATALLSLVPAIAVADAPKRANDTPALTVTSPAFNSNGLIPAEFTCDGNDISPPLSWSNLPEGTRSVAILVEDPDAPSGTVTHWMVTGIPASTTSLDKGAALPAGAMAARNDRGNAGYMGPCPPSGRHRYRFQVYALDHVPAKVTTKAEFTAALRGHVLAMGQLVGRYQKQAR